MKKTILLGMVTVLSALSLMGCIQLPLEGDANSQATEETKVDEQTLKARALLEEGRNCLFGLEGKDVDYETALRCFMEAAELRLVDGEDLTAEANYYIGHIYDYGYGVVPDYEKAYEYLSKAEEAMNPKALYALGFMYYNGDYVEEDKDKAAAYFLQASEMGLVEANNGFAQQAYDEEDFASALTFTNYVVELGAEPDLVATALVNRVDLYTDVEVLADYDAALESCQKAVDLNYPWAYNYMGLLYHYGYGVEQDYAKAAEWYEKAAEWGCGAGYYNLGNTYLYQYGVDYDPNKAAEYYEKAANRGYVSAMYKLGIMHYGETVEYTEKFMIKTFKNFEADYDAARKWIEAAAERGNAKAMLHMGEIYMDNILVEQDRKEAIKWYEMAAEKGNVSAMVRAGMLYEEGIFGKVYLNDVRMDEIRAFRYYTQAAENGSALGAYRLACMYANDENAMADYEEALKWAKVAQEKGHTKAQELIDRIGS